MNFVNVCVGSNIGWLVVSLIGVGGSMLHPNIDILFFGRYILALLSSVLSFVAIRYYRQRIIGRSSVCLFVPFIILQLLEILVVYKCEKEPEISSYWGVSCSTLLVYPDGAKIAQVITDELAVFLLSVVNMFILVNCHILHGHLLYDLVEIKNVNRDPFLSYNSAVSEEQRFISAEEGDAGNRVGICSGKVGQFQSNFTRVRSMAQPALVQSLEDLNSREVKTISDLQASLGGSLQATRFGVHDWLKLAWSRSLDAEKAADVVKYHQEFIDKFNLSQIPMGQVRENFKAGFSVLAGRDFDGRPMLWQRMQFMTPATIPLDVGIKSTWLAMDAALADLESNRVGVCLIYDFSNVGMRNISLNLFDVRDGSLACGAGHPSHISRVIFLNSPFVFRMGYSAAKPLLPTSVTSVVQMINTDDEADGGNWYDNLCPRTQLPEYLGGEQKGDYFAWLARRLEGSNLLYHPERIQQDPTNAAIGQ